MGKLRLAPKYTFDYAALKKLLFQARSAEEGGYQAIYDTDPDEDTDQMVRDLRTVARQENLRVRIQKSADNSSLIFEFDLKIRSAKVTPEEYKRRVMAALKASEQPMGKRAILAATGLPGTVWHIRIKDLVSQGKIIRLGTVGDSTYKLA